MNKKSGWPVLAILREENNVFSSPLDDVLILSYSTLKNGALVLAQLFIYKKIIVIYSKFKACILLSGFLPMGSLFGVIDLSVFHKSV